MIVRFPFISSRKSDQKARPALVISDMTISRRYGDLILAAITSRVPHDPTETELILETTPENGLKTRSCLRLEFLMTIPIDLVSRRIGRLTSQEMEQVDLCIAASIGMKRSG